MNRYLPALLLSPAVVCVLWSAQALATDSAQVKALFADPPREYATAPLWVWNDMLTEQEVVSTLRDLAAQGVKQAFVHPRPGLMTPYLSDDWFKLWNAALAEARKLDMNLWIYDENSYPSGFAGGWVPELMPESRGRGLFLREFKEGEQLPKEVLGIYRIEGHTARNILLSSATQTKSGDLLAFVKRAENEPWNADRCYVDLLYPGVTQKFLEITLDAYKQHFGDEFGKRIPGSFTDEPNLLPAGGLPWTTDLPEVFQKRWGYSLLDNLPCLARGIGDFKHVRYNYYQTLSDLFIDRWAKPYHDYCEKNHLEFTGHYWEHSWPITTGVPDNMAMAAWQQRPGIDILMNQYDPGVHGQFGNARAVRELASVANQLGRPRTLCEAYGASGWDMRFEDMKRIGDWLYALGVNTLDGHLSYITIRGARKRDHPQSFSYHEPWWQDYHVLATYFARLSAVMSAGEQVNKILLIEPTTTAWMYNTQAGNDKHLTEIGDAFQKLVMDLETAQIEYDIGDEDIIARSGSVDGKTLKVGKRSYETVILPPFTENLTAKTIDLLESFSKAGGKILGIGQPPALVDGKPSDRGGRFVPADAWLSSPDALKLILTRLERPLAENHVSIRREDGDRGALFHHCLQLDDGEILFIVNTSIEHSSSGTIGAMASGVEEWNLNTGKAEHYQYTNVGDGNRAILAGFELPPCGSLLLFLPHEQLVESKPAPDLKVTTFKPSAAPQIRPLEPNVLTLDYADVTAGGETKKDVYFYQAQQFAFRKNGLARNPWDSAVQFKDESISKKFPPESGFEAGYKFTLAGEPPKQLFIVIERPDLYTITCNGQPVSAEKGQWWLDKSFGKIDISKAAKGGENVVTIKASPFTIYHELESAYLLGDFTLKPAEKGFIAVPEEPLKLGKWNEQGRPFYAAGVTYTEKFDVPTPAGKYRVALDTPGDAARPAQGAAASPPGVSRVALPAWYGSVARVTVNGQDAGRIFHAPWECDVTGAVKPGENVIEVTVVGTLKNTLGPHHGNPPLGSAWPGMFKQAPENGPPLGTEYSTVGYGLFEPFVLKQVLN